MKKYILFTTLIIVITTTTNQLAYEQSTLTEELSGKELCLYQEQEKQQTQISTNSEHLYSITPPQDEKIYQIAQKCKKRKHLFSGIKLVTLAGTIGFISWKLLRKKQEKNPNHLEAEIENLTQRIQMLEEKISHTTRSEKPTPHWLLAEAQQLGSHAGNLIIDGLIGALIVDTVTGSITSAITKQIPLNELLSNRPSINWVLEHHTNFANHTNGCLYLLKESYTNSTDQDPELRLYYLQYHTQELMHDIEQILGFLTFEIEQTTNQKQKKKLSTLLELLKKTSLQVCQKTNLLLQQDEHTINPIDIAQEINAVQNTLEEIRARTQKKNSLIPTIF